MDAGTGHFAGREQTGHRRPAVEVHVDAAHEVVGSRTDRYPIACEIETGPGAGGGDGGKPRVNECRLQILQRQIDAAAGTFGLARDGAGDPVARREIPGRIGMPHEPGAGLVDEHRALPSERLGQQEARRAPDVQRGGVELHELQVGHARAGAVGDGNAVARGDRRVGGLPEELTRPAGGQERRGGRNDAVPPLFVQVARPRATTVHHDGIDRQRMLDHAHPGQAADPLPQYPRDLAPGRIAGVQHPPHAVGGLAGERNPAVRSTVEPCTPIDQFLHVTRSELREDAYRV